MNIEQNPAAFEQFQAAIKAKSWPAALETLVSFNVTARPSQAPKLRDAVRSDPSLLEPRCVNTSTGSVRDLVPRLMFEPDKDEHGGITADWLKDPVRLEHSMPHYSTNWRAEYQIKHHIAFGDMPHAIAVLREFGLSCRLSDFDGALFQAITQHAQHQSILRDGGTIAVARTN